MSYIETVQGVWEGWWVDEGSGRGGGGGVVGGEGVGGDKDGGVEHRGVVGWSRGEKAEGERW